MIRVEIEQHSAFLDVPPVITIKQWIKAALHKQKKHASITLKIVDEAEMEMLNKTYRNKEKTTNVLSFACQYPFVQRDTFYGDIAICAPVVEKEALEQGISLIEHWAHLVIHGVLHLLGYDHEEDNEAILMENLETDIMATLGFADPYKVEKNHD